MSLPSTRALEAFASVARLGSLKAAAGDLNITISAVNQRIQSLEQLLGTKLFFHKDRRLNLTRIGSEYLGDIVPVIDALRAAGTRLQEGVEQRFSLKIATTPILHSRWLAPHLLTFRENWPNAAIELLTLSDENAEAADVVIRPTASDTVPKGASRLFEFRVLPVCTPGMRDSLGLYSPSDLKRATLIDMKPAMQGWRAWLELAEVTDIRCNWMTVDSHQVMLDAAALGMGVTITPTFLAGQVAADGLIQPFDLICPVPGGVDVFVRNPSGKKVVNAFGDWVISTAHAANKSLEVAAA